MVVLWVTCSHPLEKASSSRCCLATTSAEVRPTFGIWTNPLSTVTALLALGTVVGTGSWLFWHVSGVVDSWLACAVSGLVRVGAGVLGSWGAGDVDVQSIGRSVDFCAVTLVTVVAVVCCMWLQVLVGGVEAFAFGLFGPGLAEADSWAIVGICGELWVIAGICGELWVTVGICCVSLGEMGVEVWFGLFVFASIWFPNLSLKACV